MKRRESSLSVAKIAKIVIELQDNIWQAYVDNLPRVVSTIIYHVNFTEEEEPDLDYLAHYGHMWNRLPEIFSVTKVLRHRLMSGAFRYQEVFIPDEIKAEEDVARLSFFNPDIDLPYLEFSLVCIMPEKLTDRFTMMANQGLFTNIKVLAIESQFLTHGDENKLFTQILAVCPSLQLLFVAIDYVVSRAERTKQDIVFGKKRRSRLTFTKFPYSLQYLSRLFDIFEKVWKKEHSSVMAPYLHFVDESIRHDNASVDSEEFKEEVQYDTETLKNASGSPSDDEVEDGDDAHISGGSEYNAEDKSSDK